MVTYNQVVNGMSRYIDQEIVNKIQGWQRWALGAGAGIMMNKGTNMFNAFKAHPVVKMLEVIDENHQQKVILTVLFSLRRRQQFVLRIIIDHGFRHSYIHRSSYTTSFRRYSKDFPP